MSNKAATLKNMLQFAHIDVQDKEKVREFIRKTFVNPTGKTEKEIEAYIDTWAYELYPEDIPNFEYKEILRLKDMLDEAKIPYVFQEGELGGYKMAYLPNRGLIPGRENEVVCSIIETPTSYGVKEDLLEISGLMKKHEMMAKQDDVLGFLTAEDVFGRISEHYKQLKEKIVTFNRYFRKIFELEGMLRNAGIPIKFQKSIGGFQIVYEQPNTDHTVSVIATMWSHGQDEDKLEIMSNDYDAIPMSKEEVFAYISGLHNG